MKSYIWLQCADGSIQQVEEEVAMFCPMICREILQTGMGSSKNYAISLPQRVNPAILSLILDYCRFHQVPGRSNKERKSFDEKFIRIDTKRLCELTSAADSLQLKPLVDLTSRALARMIEGKTPEEICETYHLPDDLTEEEKLEPLKNANDDPRIRLLNRLYAKKRKELKERQNPKEDEVKQEQKDERSVDDLLSFINGAGDSKGVKTAKNEKKNRRRKDQAKNPSRSDSDIADNKEASSLSMLCNEACGNHSPTSSRSSNVQNRGDDAFSSKIEFKDVDIDDELDPAMKEELDREVEDFARRLNSDWPERMQEILSLGQERRLVPNLMSGNGSLRRYTAGDWPFAQANQLAHLALRCCEVKQENRPNLVGEVWRVVEPLTKAASVSIAPRLRGSVQDNDSNIPSYFICPISQEIMTDPHVAADGFTYEAEAIKGWIDSGHCTSPMTNLGLPHCDLIPNRALRSTIQEWLQQRQRS